VLGDVVGQYATFRFFGRKPMQGKLLPVVVSGLYVVPGQELIGLPDVLPIF